MLHPDPLLLSPSGPRSGMHTGASSRRHLLGVLAVGSLSGSWALAQPAPAASAAKPAPAAAAATAASGACADEWPAWSAFRTQFVAGDGRVIDPDTPRAQTVSEAQAYGLFFALVGNDRPTFEKILKWTENNLAGGDLTARLPAWIWGKRDDGQWGVIDPNPASDADLWAIYALAEAGRLWADKRLAALANAMAERLLRESTANLPGLGLTLLPGPQGFQTAADSWRLNPSYFPLQQMRWFSKHMPNPAWAKLMASSRKIVLGAAPKGFAPDWIQYHATRGFEPDTAGAERGEGAYNAIRVYLWAGLMAPADSNAKALLDALAPMARFVASNGYPPESVNILSGAGPKPAPSGFSAALLPFLKARGDKAALQAQLTRLEAKPIRPKAYYEQALNLFGRGGYDGVFKFAGDGSLVTKWKVACSKTA